MTNAFLHCALNVLLVGKKTPKEERYCKWESCGVGLGEQVSKKYFGEKVSETRIYPCSDNIYRTLTFWYNEPKPISVCGVAVKEGKKIDKSILFFSSLFFLFCFCYYSQVVFIVKDSPTRNYSGYPRNQPIMLDVILDQVYCLCIHIDTWISNCLVLLKVCAISYCHKEYTSEETNWPLLRSENVQLLRT